MKTKLSVSIDEETARRLDCVVKEHGFRNRSNLIEHALDRYLREGKR
jgi:metal-responsive CopG/Arc/MetJ family transcriptional regulator